MPTTTPAEATRAELYVRGDLPKPARQCRRTATIRLEELVADGLLEDASVSSWAKRVPIDDGDALERRRYEEFAAWADREGVRLRPFFDTRECYSTETGEKRRELVTPAICLALYDGEDLLYVAPHGDDADAVTVPGCLDRLADELAADDRTAAGIEAAD